MQIINTVIDIMIIIFIGFIIIMPFVLINISTPISNALGWGLIAIYYINKYMINKE